MVAQKTASTVLIITHSNDNECISLVEAALVAQGGRSFRLDTDRFPTEVQLNVTYERGNEILQLSGPDYTLDLSSVTALWYRRVATGHGIPQDMDSQLRRVSIDESRTVLQGMITSLRAFQLDPIHHLRRAENKQLQLRVASACGLDTPRTLITNDPVAVRHFARDCDQGMVMKMLSSFAVYDEGKENVVFTNRVLAKDLEHLDELRYCPAMFQEAVPKALELRCTIVGKQVFTAAIDSQSSVRAQYDWRRDGIALIKDWTVYTLPANIKAKLLKFMRWFGLNYGAIDIIVTPEGRHIFLEVNPAGEFVWLERNPGLPISYAIAQVLMQEDTRQSL